MKGETNDSRTFCRIVRKTPKRCTGRGDTRNTQACARAPRHSGAIALRFSATLIGLAVLVGAVPAQAQESIWSGTLNVSDLQLGFGVGCNNLSPPNSDKCSNSSRLSDDDFTDNGTYSMTRISLKSTGDLTIHIQPRLPARLKGLSLQVGETAFRLRSADTITDVSTVSQRVWNDTGLSWSAGDSVSLKLTIPSPTGASIISTPRFDNTYLRGEHIEVAVDFSEAVAVSTVLGSPQLFLALGDDPANYAERPATYHDGSGTLRLVFRYAVQREVRDTTGINLSSNPLRLNGGAILVGPTHVRRRLPDWALLWPAQYIDGTVAYPTGASIISTPRFLNSYIRGEHIDVAVYFNAAVTVTGSPQLFLALGDDVDFLAERPAAYHSGSGTSRLVFRYSVQNGVRDTTGISLYRNPLRLNDGKIREGATDAKITTLPDRLVMMPTQNVNGARTDTACALPDLTRKRQVWTGTVTVGESGRHHGYGDADSFGALDDTTYRIGSTDYEVENTYVNAGEVGVANDSFLQFGLKTDLSSEHRAALTLYVCNAAYTLSSAGRHPETLGVRYAWGGTSLDWSSDATRTLYLAVRRNIAASGKPAISGTAMVGSLLTAARGTIADADGVPAESTFTYQWIRVDGSSESDISSATSSTYTLAAADAGKKFRVRVSFTDALGSEEVRTSNVYPPSVPGAPRNLEVSAGDGEAVLTWTAPASDGGAAIARYQYRYSEGTIVSSSASWANVPDGLDAGARLGDERGVTVPGLGNGTGYAFEVRAVNGAGFGAWAGPVTATPAATACAAPSYGKRRKIWTGTVTVAPSTPLPDHTLLGYAFAFGFGSLDDTSFSIGSTRFEVEDVLVYTAAASAERAGDLQLRLNELPHAKGTGEPLTARGAGQAAALTVHVCGTAYALSSADTPTEAPYFLWDAGLDWTSVDTRTLHLSLPPNHASTGRPTVSGPTMVGGTLMAATSGIADTDGLPSSFAYQWIRVDADGTSNPTDITGATSSAYTLAAADSGKKVQVKVSFMDVLGGEETRTSEAYPSATTVSMAVVPGAPARLKASAGNGQVVLTWTAPAATGGPPITGYQYRSATGTTVPSSTVWLAVPDSDDAGASTADERGVTVTGLANGTGYAFEVRAENSAGGGAKAGPVSATASATSCAAPNFGARRNIWTGNLSVGPIISGGITTGYGFGKGRGGLDDKTFSIGSNNHEIDLLGVGSSGTEVGDVVFGLKDADLTTAETAALRLHVCDTAYDFSAATLVSSRHDYVWADDLDWSSLSGRTLSVSLPANDGATGKPAISGTAEVGEMLTAATTTLADTDGLPTTFSYQWVRVDGLDETDISGATGSTYTVAAADRGRKIKVKVSFTDDLNGQETRTSDAYPASGTVPGLPTVSIAPVYAKGSTYVAYPVFRVAISAVQTSAVTVNLTIDQNAMYLSSTTQTITIPANQTSATGKFRSSYGGTTSGGLIATVAAGTGYVPEAAPEDAATVEMVAKGNAGALSFFWAAAAYSVDEGDAVAVVVRLRTAEGVPRPRESFHVSAVLTQELTDEADMAAQGALLTGAGGDYAHTSERGDRFTPNDWSADGVVFTASRTYTVPTTEDSAYEGDERFKITLSRAAGAVGSVGTPADTIVTIVDDDTVEVTGVAVTSSPSSRSTYGAGETISFTATFSEKVTVMGTPQFAFSLGGGVTRQADYASGSDSTELVFSYTVAAGDNDPDGVSWAADALSLNGGTVKFTTTVPANAVDATLTHAAGDAQSGHKVDTAPALSSAMVNGTTLTLTFGEALDTASVPAPSAFTVKVDGSAASLASGGAVEVSGSTVTLTLAAPVAASATATVSYTAPLSNPLQDVGGTDAVAFSDQTVSNGTDNVAPVFTNDAETRSFTETVGDGTVTAAVDVGAAVTATDTNNDTLAYSLEGTDASKFDIVEASGQVRTKVGRTYDREAKASYSVTVKASDGMDADTVAVTIDVDDATEVPAAPGAPSVAPTVGDATSLDASWSAPGNTGRPDITGYKLRYRQGSGAWTDHSHTGAGTSTTIASLATDTTYEVQVRAVNADGDGGWSESGNGSTGTAVATVPGAPAGFTATSGDTEATLSWAAPASDGGEAITHYRYRHAAGTTVPLGTAWIDVLDSGDAGASTADERRLAVTGLANGTAYAFELHAVNGVGEGPAASATATPLENQMPSAVVDLRALTGDGMVTLTWAAAGRSGTGSHIACYEYRHAAGSTVPSGTPWQSVEAVRYPYVQVSGLDNGRRYAFEVRAVNAGGSEGPAVRLVATPRAEAAKSLPTAPRALRAKGSLYERGVSELGQVTLSWEAPADLGNTLLVRYEYRYAEDGASLSSAPWNHGPVSERTLTERTLAAGTSYTFELRAVTLVGVGPAATVGASTPRSQRLILSVFTRGAAVEGQDLTIGVRRSGKPDPDEAVLAVVEIYDSALSRPTAKAVDIPTGVHEGTIEFPVPFDGERGAARELAVTLGPGTWKPERSYTVGTTPARATVQVRNMDPLLSVRDATVDEGPQAQLSFDVSLDRVAAQAVTVDYATSDGTATSGADYTATSGTLSFAAGELAQTVSVRVLDDAHDERTETLTLTLVDATGAAIDDATATGRIVNTDPMPKAWLARFGRTASDHVIQAIESRLHGDGSAPPQSHLTIGGRRVDAPFDRAGSATAVDVRPDTRDPRFAPRTPGARPYRLKAEALGLAGGSHAGSGAAPHVGLAPGNGFAPEGGSAPRSGAGWLLAGLLGLSDLEGGLMDSSFLYASPADGGDAPAWPGRWTVWGQIAETRFDGADGALSVHGEVATATVGFDTGADRWLAGVAVSYSLGEGAYAQAQAGGGRVASSLASVSPFARFELSERTSLWGVLGHGAGRLSLRPEGAGAAMEAELRNTMTAFGARSALTARAGSAGRFDLSLVSDARLTSTVSDTVAGLVGTTGETGRVRFLLEGAGSVPLATGGTLTPTLEAGLRYDSGDAETGAGVEFGAGLGYAAGRFALQVNARGLVAHEDAGYEEWGVSGTARYRAARDGRGLSFDLGSAWGATQSGVEGLWNRQDASGLARGAALDAAPRLKANLGYGLHGPKGRALWVPYLGVEFGQGGSQALQIGLKLSSGPNAEAGVEFGRQGGGAGGGAPERAVQLHWGLRW